MSSILQRNYQSVTGIGWDRLSQQLGYGSGMTCWRRLHDWTTADVWEQMHQLLLAELHAADQLDWSRTVADASHIRSPRLQAPPAR